MGDERRDEPRDNQPDPEAQRLPGDDEQTEPVRAPVDEDSYAASSAESGGLYNADGPTVANSAGDTMGTRDEAEPGEESASDPFSG
jgi:hypothetical protein